MRGQVHSIQEGRTRWGQGQWKERGQRWKRFWKKNEFSNPFNTDSKQWRALRQGEVLSLCGWELGSGRRCSVPVKCEELAEYPWRIVFQQLEIVHGRLGERLGQEMDISGSSLSLGDVVETVPMDQLRNSGAWKCNEDWFPSAVHQLSPLSIVATSSKLESLQRLEFLTVMPPLGFHCLAFFQYVRVIWKQIFKQDPNALQVRAGGLEKLAIP